MIKILQAQLDTRLHLIKQMVIWTQNQRDSCGLPDRAKRTLEGWIKRQKTGMRQRKMRKLLGAVGAPNPNT